MSSWRERLTGPHPTWFDLGLRCLLRPLCIAYGSAITVRNILFDLGWMRSHRVSVPVISVGNLSVGGTGKTPAVAWIAQWLRRQGLHVVVLSRGYGKLPGGSNDEALELEWKLPGIPHIQHQARAAAAARAISECQAQVIVLDDGFQHRRLHRDLDVVLLDATDSRAARRLLPAGLHREPMSALRRSDVVILTRCDQVGPTELERLRRQIVRLNPKAVCLRSVHQPQALLTFPDKCTSVQALRGRRVFAFCGIGNPDAFFKTLESLGAALLGTRTWPDHHAYQAADLEWLAARAWQHPDATMVCTLKDWVKIHQPRIGPCELCALRIDFQFLDCPSPLEKKLRELIQTENSEERNRKEELRCGLG